MYKPLKRLIDILIALLALVILSPILLPVIIILQLTGEHKVFYFQQRVGYHNRDFSIYKFATMLQNSPNIGTGEITLRNDPRVTAFGKLLRKSKINELPQIINVLKGDMSIVGPRPLMKKSFDLYSDDIKEKIYLSKPGITGIGSVIFRDEEKMVSEAADFRYMYSNIIYPYKGKLELWYLQHASVATDIKIIFLTGWSILFPENQLAKTFFKNLPARDF